MLVRVCQSVLEGKWCLMSIGVGLRASVFRENWRWLKIVFTEKLSCLMDDVFLLENSGSLIESIDI